MEETIDKIIIKKKMQTFSLKSNIHCRLVLVFFIESFIYFIILLLLYSQIPYIIFNHNIYCTHTLYVIIKIIIEQKKCTFVNKSNGIKYSIYIKYRDLSWKKMYSTYNKNNIDNMLCSWYSNMVRGLFLLMLL